MIRAFTEHRLRRSNTLDGRWDFVIAPDRQDDDTLPANYDRSCFVPSCWETLPGLEAYRGKGWLRREFETTGGNVRLVFGGVSHTATIYVDGEEEGNHYDAFTPFDVILPDMNAGIHECVVEVDNSFGDHSALHRDNDYFSYGGITRPVELQELADCYIDKVYATPTYDAGWRLDISVKIRNCSDRDQCVSVKLYVADSKQTLDPVTVPAGGDVDIQSTTEVLAVSPWSADHPDLYDLSVVLNKDDAPIDDKIDRIGFREVLVDGKQLLLNGEEVRLQGYNRHEDHAQFGCAIPLEAMAIDLDLMNALGCNFIRTCHYPNDLRFLDLCDEYGFYVWEESHCRSVPFDAPAFDQQIRNSTREMLEWHYNRPSIIMWGCLNECDSKTESGREVHARVLQQLKEFDTSRPVTFASNKGRDDLCLGLVDIVSWNIYTGWYGGGIDYIESHINEMLAWLHSDASHGGQGKPVIMSEFGGGAIYGNRQRCRSQWSEEYQSELLDELLRVYLNHPDIIGSAIWQFCDVRVTDGHWKDRPRTMNNKGTVDEYRRPKLSYETVKARMHETRA